MRVDGGIATGEGRVEPVVINGLISLDVVRAALLFLHNLTLERLSYNDRVTLAGEHWDDARSVMLNVLAISLNDCCPSLTFRKSLHSAKEILTHYVVIN
jgi:hypothetical protein